MKPSTLLLLFALLLFSPAKAVFAQGDTSQSLRQNGLQTGGAQDQDDPWFRIGGSMRLSADYYTMDPDPAGVVRSRRPANLYRLYIAPTMRLGDVNLPITLLLSSDQTNVTTPRVAEQGFQKFLTNPMNRISAAPQYKWATLYLGHHVPRYSDLSTGDIQLFGAGVNLDPGFMQIAAFHGIAERAAESSAPAFARPTYERTITTARLGFGSPGVARIALNLVRLFDDTTSISVPDDNARAEEGLLLTLTADFKPVDVLSVAMEFGGSAFTRDQRAPQLTDDRLDAVSDLLTIRESSYADFAAAMSLGLDFEDFGVEARGRFLGAGYEPLGFPYMQSDNLEITVAPRLRLFDGKLDFSASVGQRYNNISDTATATTQQLLASGNVLVQFSPDFLLSAAYTNFGFRSDVDEFNVRSIEMISHSFTISPMMTIPTENIVHQLSATFAYDDFNDENVFNGALNSSTTRSIFANYAAQFTAIPLNASIGFNNLVSSPDSLQNDAAFNSSSLDVNSIHAGLGYRLLDGKMTPNLKFTWSSSSIGEFSADSNILMRLGLKYRPVRRLTFSLNASLKLYEYGSQRPDVSFTENFVQTAVSTNF